jgi:hypothetical protein
VILWVDVPMVVVCWSMCAFVCVLMNRKCREQNGESLLTRLRRLL